jgi:hypothetical protein
MLNDIRLSYGHPMRRWRVGRGTLAGLQHRLKQAGGRLAGPSSSDAARNAQAYHPHTDTRVCKKLLPTLERSLDLDPFYAPTDSLEEIEQIRRIAKAAVQHSADHPSRKGCTLPATSIGGALWHTEHESRRGAQYDTPAVNLRKEMGQRRRRSEARDVAQASVQDLNPLGWCTANRSSPE